MPPLPSFFHCAVAATELPSKFPVFRLNPFKLTSDLLVDDSKTIEDITKANSAFVLHEQRQQLFLNLVTNALRKRICTRSNNPDRTEFEQVSHVASDSKDSTSVSLDSRHDTHVGILGSSFSSQRLGRGHGIPSPV